MPTPGINVPLSADREALKPGQEYPYSYSLNSLDLEGETNPGMSSIVTPQRKLYAFKTVQVKNPAGKIMLVDEDRATLDDSRWAPGYDNLICQRHNGRGIVALEDGHIQSVLPAFGKVDANTRATF